MRERGLLAPAGMRKRRGTATRGMIPKEINTIINPVKASGLRCNTKVMREIASAPPIFLNIFLRPTIVPTFSGINSMHALLAEGNTIPALIPLRNIIIENVPMTPPRAPPALVRRRPGVSRIIPSPIVIKPITIGHR